MAMKGNLLFFLLLGLVCVILALLSDLWSDPVND